MDGGDPGKWLSFLQLPGFVADWKALDLDDESLRELELLLVERPDAGAVVAGTGGMRKVRFSPGAWARGKSGAARVGYACFLRAGTIVLMAAFGKSEKANFSAAERNALKQVVTRLRQSLGE